MNSVLNYIFLLLVMTIGAIDITPSVASAKVTRIEITTKQPDGSFQAGEYVRWEGHIKGELSPVAELIPDLDKPARNAKGMVEYEARIMLFMPANADGGNGALLIDVPNRGHAYARALYNSPRGLPFQSGNLSQGTGFLEDNGFTFAEVYWELGRARSCRRSLARMASSDLSRASDSQSCATPPTFWRMTHPTHRARPIL